MPILLPHLAGPSLPSSRPMSAVSLMQEWVHVSDQLQMRGQLSSSISSSKVAATTRALWWASLTLAKFLCLQASLFLGVWLPRGWMPVDLGSPNVCGVSLHSHPWWSSKEDTTSATSSRSPGRDPGSLWSL